MKTMLKFKLLLAFLLVLQIDAFSQQLTKNEKSVFDEIAYFRIKPDDYLRITKWVVPIRYKLYGDSSEHIKKEIDSTFAQLKRLTGLDIQKTNDDDEVNFVIAAIIDDKVYPNVSAETIKHTNRYGGYYFKGNNKNEIYRVENIIFPVSYKEKIDLRSALKKSIIKSLGFFMPTEQVPNSFFYSQGNGKLKIDAFDSHIISTLYLPAIKPGMQIEEVNKILNPNGG